MKTWFYSLFYFICSLVMFYLHSVSQVRKTTLRLSLRASVRPEQQQNYEKKKKTFLEKYILRTDFKEVTDFANLSSPYFFFIL